MEATTWLNISKEQQQSRQYLNTETRELNTSIHKWLIFLIIIIYVLPVFGEIKLRVVINTAVRDNPEHALCERDTQLMQADSTNCLDEGRHKYYGTPCPRAWLIRCPQQQITSRRAAKRCYYDRVRRQRSVAERGGDYGLDPAAPVSRPLVHHRLFQQQDESREMRTNWRSLAPMRKLRQYTTYTVGHVERRRERVSPAGAAASAGRRNERLKYRRCRPADRNDKRLTMPSRAATVGQLLSVTVVMNRKYSRALFHQLNSRQTWNEQAAEVQKQKPENCTLQSYTLSTHTE